MSKKWFWIGFIVIIGLFIVGYLYHVGVIKTNWQWLTIILAALAAPSQFLATVLGGKNRKVEKMLLAQKNRMQSEQAHRIAYDQVIKEKEQKIQELEAELAEMEDKLDSLTLQQQEVEKQVNNTTNLDELENEFLQAYGDED